jgi:hypothetical protein
VDYSIFPKDQIGTVHLQEPGKLAAQLGSAGTFFTRTFLPATSDIRGLTHSRHHPLRPEDFSPDNFGSTGSTTDYGNHLLVCERHLARVDTSA